MAQGGEWNQVKRKGGRLRNIPAPTNDAADSLSDGIRPNPNPDLSVDDLLKAHETFTKDWQASEWWEQVRQVLDSALSKPGVPVITKAVCLGTGPYEPKSRSGQNIKCVVQEPRFTSTDKAFCAKLGLDAVDSPDGFSQVDEHTLLFGIHMELDIYNQALAKLPGIYVGASLGEWEKVVNHDDAGADNGPLAAFKKMEASYDKYVFPDIEYMFSSTVMYWRRDMI